MQATAHAVLATHDLDRARRFYEKQVGAEAEMVAAEAGNVMYRIGDTRFLLYRTEVPLPPEPTTMLLVVDDIDAAMAELEERDVDFTDLGGDDGPMTVMRDEMAASAWFKDPDGNNICISQMLG